jgi:putative DNA primase/helicase
MGRGSDRIKELAAKLKPPPSLNGHAGNPVGEPGTLSDDEIIRIASRAKNGKKFMARMAGSLDGHNEDKSKASLALCNLLAFYAGANGQAQVDRLFRRSALMRAEWDEPSGDSTCGNRTIAEAYRDRTEFYARRKKLAISSNGNGKHTTNGVATAEEPPEQAHLTDRGNARRLVDRHGHDMRHCHPWRKYLVWDGTRWRMDDTGEPMRRAKETIHALFSDAANEIQRIGRQLAEAADEEVKAALQAQLSQAQKVLAWALKSEASPRLSAILDLASSDQPIPIVPAQLDTDPFAFNVANGTLDLRTGELRSHKREDYLTKICPTEYHPEAQCPRFLQALKVIFDSDTDLVEFVQRSLGYSLSGDVREQVLPLWWGSGSNGKSVLISAILETIGADYAGMVPPELLMETRGEQHPTIMADLFGKRLMVAAETGQGRRLNESRLKVLTGGDRIKARRMREDFWEFSPTHKLTLITNHRPEVQGTDHAVWRRLRLVPFSVRFLDPAAPENATTTIPDHLRIDRQLPKALEAERVGILAWLVRGCLAWQEHGLPFPAKIRIATNEYRTAEDTVGAFVAEACLTGPSDYRIRASDLYARYSKWTEAAGERPLSQKRFGDALSDRGHERFTSNGHWYRGITLRPEEAPEEAVVSPWG